MKEKAQEKDLGQVTSRERNESEPLPCRKELDGVETMGVREDRGTKLRRDLLTDGAASGIQVA